MERDDQVGGGAPAGRGDLLGDARGTPPVSDLPGAAAARGEETTIHVSGPAPGGPALGDPAPGGPTLGGAVQGVQTQGGPAPAGPASGGTTPGGTTPGGTTPGGTAPEGGTAAELEQERIARERTAPGSVRAEDTEPYIGLQYIARLFKIVSFLVLIALGLEMLLGIASDGASAILPLFAEIVQGGVLAAILWGAADVVLLLIDLGHDVRAERVLLGRISARGEQQYGGQRKRERER
ncbi:MAG TPA: hypothetical protein VF613_24765 [Longimicrobium sp.]